MFYKTRTTVAGHVTIGVNPICMMGHLERIILQSGSVKVQSFQMESTKRGRLKKRRSGKNLHIYGLNIKDAQDQHKWKRHCTWLILASRKKCQVQMDKWRMILIQSIKTYENKHACAQTHLFISKEYLIL